MRAAVLIPTYRRPADLRRCLAGLAAGNRRPDQIVVVFRPEDDASAAVVAEFVDLPITRKLVTQTGVVAATNLGLDGADADFIAFIDDDAVPHADWLERIEQWYRDQPHVGDVLERV